MQKKLKELGVQLVKIDMTSNQDDLKNELARADRKTIPVNLIYPANYSAENPAIMLEEIISPKDALEALDRLK